MLLFPGFHMYEKSKWERERGGGRQLKDNQSLTVKSHSNKYVLPCLELFKSARHKQHWFTGISNFSRNIIVVMNPVSRGTFYNLTNNVSGCLLQPLSTITRMRSHEIWQLGLKALFTVIFSPFEISVISMFSHVRATKRHIFKEECYMCIWNVPTVSNNLPKIAQSCFVFFKLSYPA